VHTCTLYVNVWLEVVLPFFKGMYDAAIALSRIVCGQFATRHFWHGQGLACIHAHGEVGNMLMWKSLPFEVLALLISCCRCS
jgi:hypothetical protein